jgi:branched-chain amino acid transport system substrate-binding protein
LHRQYLDAGLCHKIISYGARGSEKAAIEALGAENVSYVLSGVWWSPQLADSSPLAKKFIETFKAKYGGRTPEWFQAMGYETARALFVAIQQAGTVDREAVRAKLAAFKIDSLLPGGSLEFTAATGGQAQNPFILQENMPDGSSPMIYPKDVAKVAGIAPNPRCAQ